MLVEYVCFYAPATSTLLYLVFVSFTLFCCGEKPIKYYNNFVSVRAYPLPIFRAIMQRHHNKYKEWTIFCRLYFFSHLLFAKCIVACLNDALFQHLNHFVWFIQMPKSFRHSEKWPFEILKCCWWQFIREHQWKRIFKMNKKKEDLLILAFLRYTISWIEM